METLIVISASVIVLLMEVIKSRTGIKGKEATLVVVLLSLIFGVGIFIVQQDEKFLEAVIGTLAITQGIYNIVVKPLIK